MKRFFAVCLVAGLCPWVQTPAVAQANSQGVSVVQICAREIAARRALEAQGKASMSPANDAEMENVSATSIEAEQEQLEFGQSILSGKFPMANPDDQEVTGHWIECMSRARIMKLRAQAAPAGAQSGIASSSLAGQSGTPAPGGARTAATGASSGRQGQVALNAPDATAGKSAAKPPELAPDPVSDCVRIDPQAVLYGGFENICDMDVYVSYCAFHPIKGAWNELFDCEKQAGGMDHIAAHGKQAAHTNGTHMYWFACPAPSWPVGGKFVPGEGIYARCG